jgi:YD repeat-containing protein
MIIGCAVIAIVAILAGPVSSGAILLLGPASMDPVPHELPECYKPLHKGSIDLGTGLYIRKNEDLVVPGVPALILRRTYLSNYRASQQFGVGTSHDGEVYLWGDGKKFQTASLILSTGTRINFERVSPGTTFLNAMYEHKESPGEWKGARLGWTGTGWALRRTDGALSLFQSCGVGSVCSILQQRDADGHTTTYRRNSHGRLARIEADTRWIAFEYDGDNRIARAHDSTQREVRYEYDAKGRLSRVLGADGQSHRYTYTPLDQMATIVEPGTDIQNSYDENGRCIRQVNRYEDSEPYVFEFSYVVEDNSVVQTDVKSSDDRWTSYRFTNGYATAETWGSPGVQPAFFTYEREATTNTVTALTVTCPDRRGIPLRHSSIVRNGNEDLIKLDLLQTHCSWRRPPSAELRFVPTGPS